MKFSLVLLSIIGAVCAQELVDIPSTALNAGNFSILLDALEAADLVGALSATNGTFTVFAPPDEAFTIFSPEIITCLFAEENIDVLSSILTYHVVPVQVLSTDLVDGDTPETLNGDTVLIGVSDVVTINDATVITPDIQATNGVIHIIDNGTYDGVRLYFYDKWNI